MPEVFTKNPFFCRGDFTLKLCQFLRQEGKSKVSKGQVGDVLIDHK